MRPLPVPLISPDLAGLFRHLPEGGLAARAVHEFRAPQATAAHIVFAVLLLVGLPGATPILWVSTAPSIYPPGLAGLGLDPARCLFAKAKDDAECLGTLEACFARRHGRGGGSR